MSEMIVKFHCDERGIARSWDEVGELVRCKDCKHIQKWRSEESAKKFGQIYECERSVLDCPKPEDFCSKAERKGEENE